MESRQTQQDPFGGDTSGAGAYVPMTSSEIALRRFRGAASVRLRLQQETPEGTAVRLSQRATYERIRRQNLRQQETPEQTALRLSQNAAAYEQLRCQNQRQGET